MSEISDLKQRVEAVGQKFGRLAEQESSYGERLAGLLNAVEEGFARSQRETQTLKTELENATSELQNATSELQNATSEAKTLSVELDAAKDEARQRRSERDDARDECKQLRGMLLALLEAVESGGNLDLGSTMRNLESRIDRIVSTTDADLDKPRKEDTKEPDAAAPQPAEAEPAEAPKSAEAAPVDAMPAEAEPAEVPPVPAESEGVEDAALVLTKDAPPETAPAAPAEPAVEPAVEPAAEPTAEHPAEPTAKPSSKAHDISPEDILASVAESEAPGEPEAAVTSHEANRPDSKAAEPPSDDDLSAVNKIIQRISLLTGEFVEPSQMQPDAAEDLSVPSLKIGNGANDAGSSKSKASAKDGSAAKSP